jgi:hypothetical protein
MLSTRFLKILHVPVDLGGHPSAIARAQRELGHEAQCVSLAWSPLGFNGDECQDAPLGKRGRLLRREIGRWRLLWRSVAWADVVHCHFGQSIMSVRPLPLADPRMSGPIEALTVAYAKLAWLTDIRLWRALGKPVAMTFYGDDARLTDAATRREPWTHLHDAAIAQEARRRDGLKRRLFAELERRGVTILATNPDLLAELPAGSIFQPYAHVDPLRTKVSPPKETGRLRFVHMPTNRSVKGTAFFIQAIETLRARGHDVSLTLVESRSNVDALNILGEHDVLLDQLRVGWYGAVAVEAMARGKPVVAHLNAMDKALIAPAFAADIPIIEATPETVVDALERLVMMPRTALRGLGLRSRAFAETWHDPRTVARTALAAYGLR